MAGAATTEVRSAYVAETTPGTIPATPGFTTFLDIAAMKATPTIREQFGQFAGGARVGSATAALPVEGALEGNLIYGNLDDIFETLLQGSWSTDVLKDAKEHNTVTIENTVPAGAAGASKYLRYRGVEAVGGSLTLKSEEEIKYALEFIGMGSDDSAAAIVTGATYTDPTNVTPLVSGIDVGTLAFSGYTLDCMAELTINFNFADREPQPRLGSDFDYCGVTRGAFRPEMTARMYVDTNFTDFYDAARSTQTAFSVTVPMGSISGSKYSLVFPQCKFGATEIDFSEKDVMQNITILPEYESTTNDSVIVLTRAVA